jgi:N-acylglucosamine 2-epimerase
VKEFAEIYRRALLDDVIPFWLRHGMDREQGGILTALDRDGSVLDTDKSLWFQGRAGWMFGTLYRTLEKRPEWLEASRSCVQFIRDHGEDETGKLYFTVTRDGRPLRMRRYVYSESFACIANAVLAKISGDERAAADAVRYFETYLHHSFTPGVMAPKSDPSTRPSKGIGPLMIGIVTAQEIRENLGDLEIAGATCTQWIDRWIAEIDRDFLKRDLEVLLETVSPKGELIDHFDGRMINPGHAIEAAWFILHEGRLRNDQAKIRLGLTILDWSWKRGWDEEFGGLLYFRDVKGLPVQEYWHDMKFWWPHNEAVIATLLAWKITGEEIWRTRHRQVHDWSFAHFADPEFGEWFGYLHRDGTPSVRLKGNMWKGPFHLPRMLWFGLRLLESAPREERKGSQRCEL